MTLYRLINRLLPYLESRRRVADQIGVPVAMVDGVLNGQYSSLEQKVIDRRLAPRAKTVLETFEPRKNIGKALSRPKLPPRARIWQSIRILRAFSMTDLAATADTSIYCVRAYLGQLTRAGLIAKSRREGTRLGAFAEYRLIRDTGPKAPQAKHGGVFDPNHGVFHPEKTQEALNHG